MHDIDPVVYRLAARQRGAFSRRQVLDAGGHDVLIRRRLLAGVWLVVRDGVYELNGLPPDPDRRLWVAWLAVLGDVARRGKRGMRKLAGVLASRAPGDPVPDSVLERMLLGALHTGGLPTPIAQYPHPGRTPDKGRVDFAYPAACLILEADGRRWHQRMTDMARDRARDNEAARAGWLTMRFMWEELRHDPIDVGRAVAEALGHRSEGNASRPA